VHGKIIISGAIKMPTYDYECKHCSAEVKDVFQKVTDPELTTCPKCYSETGLFKVITGGIHGSVMGYNTIGSVADKNADRNKTKIQEIEAKRKEENPEPKNPWYYGDATSKEINKMTQRQKIKYIMEGKK
jgi:putative FmdB family regulatory protein